MERPIDIGYVKGYTDASEKMTKAIQLAISKNHSNMLGAVNDIITILHTQGIVVENLTDELEEQVELENEFDEIDEWEDALNELMDTIYGGVTSGKFTIIVGNN